MTVWTPVLVEERLAEAAFVLKRLPEPRRQGYFSTWPEFVYSFADKVGQEPKPMRVLPSPQAISRIPAQSVSGWMPWWTPESEPGSSRSQMTTRSAKPLFSGSFRAENVCWRAKRGTSLATGPDFWEATRSGSHPRTAEITR